MKHKCGIDESQWLTTKQDRQVVIIGASGLAYKRHALICIDHELQKEIVQTGCNVAPITQQDRPQLRLASPIHAGSGQQLNQRTPRFSEKRASVARKKPVRTHWPFVRIKGDIALRKHVNQ
ncbi:hypothetical protein D3C85_1147580 [compost metagenome]